MKKKELVLNPQIKEKKSILTIALFVILSIYFLSLLIPIIWAFYSSFNDWTDYRGFYSYGNAFPTKLTLNNFTIALRDFYFSDSDGIKYHFEDMIIYSLFYTFGSSFVFTATPCLVAYCAARFKFRFSKIIYAFVIIAMALPIVGTMPSEIRMLKNLQIFDSFFGMFVLRMNFISVYFLIFYAQFEMIPMTYTEAAKVDGASNLRIMFTIILPQAIPTIFTIFLLSFISFWNEYQIPLVYLPSYPTVSEGLYHLSITGEGLFNYEPVKLAGFIGLTIPIVTIFALLNKFLRINVAAGGIKG